MSAILDYTNLPKEHKFYWALEIVKSNWNTKEKVKNQYFWYNCVKGRTHHSQFSTKYVEVPYFVLFYALYRHSLKNLI